jgi:hypothetical protein
VLYVTLSVGLISWDPELHPVDDAEQLAQELESQCNAAMERVRRDGGNGLSVARLPSMEQPAR